MKITKHGENLIQLTRLKIINCYFVQEEDGFTLIDTGPAGSAREILAAARASGNKIKRIILTHGHSDHIGSLDALQQELHLDEIAITTREARLLNGDTSLDAHEDQAKVRGGFPHCQTQFTRLLQPGDHVGSLMVLATPGHTPGHAAFLDLRDQSIIAGDAFQTLGGVAVSGMLKPLFPLMALATWSKTTALDSAHAVRALEPSRLAVGHGPVLEDPLTAMDQAISELGHVLKKTGPIPENPEKQQHAYQSDDIQKTIQE